MPRFELTVPAAPDRTPMNLFTGQAMVTIRGRPATIDSLEIDVDCARVIEVRGAVDSASGVELFPPQKRFHRYASHAEADAASKVLMKEAILRRYRPVANRPGPLTPFVPLDPLKESAASFIDKLASVPWFVNLGALDTETEGVLVLPNLDAWAGPEDESGEALNEAFEAWAYCGPPIASPDVAAIVTNHASWNINFDPREDPWHPATAAIGTAAQVSDIVARYLASSRLLPENLQAMWSWFARGHWPVAIDPESGSFVVI